MNTLKLLVEKAGIKITDYETIKSKGELSEYVSVKLTEMLEVTEENILNSLEQDKDNIIDVLSEGIELIKLSKSYFKMPECESQIKLTDPLSGEQSIINGIQNFSYSLIIRCKLKNKDY